MSSEDPTPEDRRTERIEITKRQRDRIEGIKDECKEADPGVPRLTDQQVVKSLLDTWDAVNEGLYSDTDRQVPRDYGQPGPKTCVACGTEFHRSLNECPECGSTHIGINPHPRDEWTAQLVRDTVRGLAGYGVLHIELPADCQAWMWWDDGFEGRSRHPGGALESFSLGIDDTLNDARSIEIVHWRETHPQIRQQIEQALPRPVEARET